MSPRRPQASLLSLSCTTGSSSAKWRSCHVVSALLSRHLWDFSPIDCGFFEFRLRCICALQKGNQQAGDIHRKSRCGPSLGPNPGLPFYRIQPCWGRHGFAVCMVGHLGLLSTFPVFVAICWSKANNTSAMIGMPSGLTLGVMTWLVTYYKLERSLTVANLSADYPVLAGDLVSIIIPTVITVAGSCLWPEKYDFEGTRAIGRKFARPSPSVPGSPKRLPSPNAAGDTKAPLASPERQGSEDTRSREGSGAEDHWALRHNRRSMLVAGAVC